MEQHPTFLYIHASLCGSVRRAAASPRIEHHAVWPEGVCTAFGVSDQRLRYPAASGDVQLTIRLCEDTRRPLAEERASITRRRCVACCNDDSGGSFCCARPGATWTFHNVKLTDGSFVDSSGTYSTVPVPEPATFAISVAALLGLGLVSRRRVGADVQGAAGTTPGSAKGSFLPKGVPVPTPMPGVRRSAAAPAPDADFTRLPRAANRRRATGAALEGDDL
jgi:hypothetical protein